MGVFAQEANFDTAAAAAVWQSDNMADGEEYLLILDGLALANEVMGSDDSAPSRWQQHAILRAYALSLQEAHEELIWLQKHADYYLTVSQECYLSRPRDYERME